MAASRAGALQFRNSNFIGNYNSQQRGTEMAQSAFQLLENTLSVGQSLSSVPVAIGDLNFEVFPIVLGGVTGGLCSCWMGAHSDDPNTIFITHNFPSL